MSFVASAWWRGHARVVRAWGIALACGVMVWTLADVAYRGLPHPEPLEELSYYPSGVHLKPATMGHPETAADLAWLRAVQYYGEHRETDNRFTKMEHVFDILTSLSPDFIPAYVFGGFALAQEGHDFPAAERLMMKGLEANPRSGELAFEMGFLYYVRPGGRDLDKAARYFEQAARQPDGPPSSARFAAYARQHSGDLAVAYELWASIYRGSRNRYVREAAEREMERIREAMETGHKDLAVRKLDVPQVNLVK